MGLYTSGWIKRGPSGVVGTNKPDSVEIGDVHAGRLLHGIDLAAVAMPMRPAPRNSSAQRKPDYFSYADWKCLDELEQDQRQSLRSAAREVHQRGRDEEGVGKVVR